MSLASSESVAMAVEAASYRIGGVQALGGISFDIPKGKLVGVVGPNGSGKSTLLSAMSSLIQLDSGRIWFEGKDCADLSAYEMARNGLARTYQTVRLQDDLDVLENVMLGADQVHAAKSILANWLPLPSRRRAEQASRADAEEAIEKLGLTAVARRRPDALTYGTQRRVEIARAVASQPKVLLLDEPTAGMTRHEREEIGEILRELRDGGLTQVLVEHDVPMITELSDHLVVLNFGKLIAEGDPEECVSLPQVREAYLGRRYDTTS